VLERIVARVKREHHFPTSIMPAETFDVIVIGSGNAGFSAAVSARESGAPHVLLLDKCPSAWAGGNSTFTAGAFRTVFNGLDDVLPIVHNVSKEMETKIDMDAYTEQNFYDDLNKVTSNRSHPELADVLIKESRATTKWLAKNGIRFVLSFNRQAYEIDGRQKFWGGMVLATMDGGKGLIADHQAAAKRAGVEVRYENAVVGLLQRDDSSVYGVVVRRKDGSIYRVHAKGGVVLAAGGFEANPQMRSQFIGPGWDLASVRGTPYNTGDLLNIAINTAGAKPAGNWSGCHSTCWDAQAPYEAGDQVLTNQFTKSGYPLGLMFNADGDRFVDEGIDMRNFTYAKFGREILKQPNGIAFQVWDADGAKWLRKEEYAEDVVERISADTIEELSEKMEKKALINPTRFVQNIKEYNEAVKANREEFPNVKFDPSVKDGLSTRSSNGGLTLDKTNWALPITKAPFLAVKITTGITFTFGGLKVDPKTSGVISQQTNEVIPGLYAAGEMVGGLFYTNYPGKFVELGHSEEVKVLISFA